MIDLLAVLFRVILLSAALLSSGFVIVFFVHRTRVNWAAPAAMVCIGALGGFAVQAAALIGDVSGMWDSAMLALLWSTPQGSALALHLVGAALLLVACLKPLRILAVAGVFMLLAGFAVVGHVADQERVALQVVIVLHLGLAAYWVGILPTLHSLALSDRAEAVRVAHAFGAVALFAVPVLVALGAVMAVTLLDAVQELWSSAYGISLVLKLLAVSAMLGLGAANRLRHVPDLAAGRAGAAHALRASLRWEALAAGIAIVATATFSTVAGLP